MVILPGGTTAANLQAAFLEFTQQFNKGMTFAQPWAAKVSYEQPSAGEQMVYPLLDKIPRLRKWLPNAERVAQSASLRGYALVNDDYELTVEIDRNKFNDDQWGSFSTLFLQMGKQAQLWPDDLLATVLQNGSSTLCYDGQNFFNASHPINIDNTALGTYSNYSSSGLSLGAANYNTAYATMESYQGADTKPLGVRPNLLVCPPQLRQAARQILNLDFIAPTAAVGQNAANVVQQNGLTGSADLLIVPQLSNQTTTWYLMATGDIFPFVFQRRQSPIFQMFTAPTDPEVFKRKKYVFGCDARGAAGYTLPFLAYSATA